MPGRRGEGARKRGGENTCVTTHDVLSPPLRDAPPHGITPLRYSDFYFVLLFMKLKVQREHKKREGKVERDLARVFYRRLSPILLKIQFYS